MIEELTEEDQELLEKYKRNKNKPVMQHGETKYALVGIFTLKEIIRLSHLIKKDTY